MSEDKSIEFTSTSQYKLKFNNQKKNLHLQVQQEYYDDLRGLSRDPYQDADVYIRDANIRLKHKCIINAVSPLLLFNNLEIKEPLDELNEICLDTFPNDIQEDYKKFLSYIYGEESKEKISIDFDEIINLNSLLDDDSYSDITFKVQDSEFKSHKCIMSSRCEYFARMFSGHWKENTQDIVELKDLSPQTFSFILSYIYSNKIEVPTDVDVTELLYIADMYGLNGIKAAVSFHLKAYYCYFFIAPYDISILGASKSLEISKIFLLNELTNECYAWFVKHYVRIFANRNFGKVVQEVKNEIVEKIKDDVSPVTILHHLKDCNKLNSCLPSVKWAQSMRKSIEELEEYCLKFVSNNFEPVISQPAFQYCLFNEKDINLTLMFQEHFLTAISKYISKENCLDIYECSKLIDGMAKRFGIEFKDVPNKTEAVNNCKKFVSDLQLICKKYISRNIFHIQKMRKWKSLKKEAKEQLMTSSGFISIADQNDNR